MNNHKRVIAVCIPSTDFFTASFSMCLATFAHLSREHYDLAFINTRSSYIPDNRNNAIKMVFNANNELPSDKQISHVLFLDNDLIFPPDILDRLLAHEQSIVGATYPRRSSPHDLCYAPLKNWKGTIVKSKVVGGGDLEEVAGLPTGAMLIDLHVFTQIPQPWFEQKYYFFDEVEPQAYDVLDSGYNEERADLAKYLNEFVPDTSAAQYPLSISCDYWFSALCRQAGYKLWLDRNLTRELEHIGSQAFTFVDAFDNKSIHEFKG